MTSTTNAPEPWFTRLIGQCLAGLYLLGLEGVPAGENTDRVAAMWVRVLWDRPILGGWIEDLDGPRLRATFAKIASTSKRWPSPASFLEAMPERPRPVASRTLADPNFGREREDDALRCRARWLESLGRDHNGAVIEGHPNAPRPD